MYSLVLAGFLEGGGGGREGREGGREGKGGEGREAAAFHPCPPHTGLKNQNQRLRPENSFEGEKTLNFSLRLLPATALITFSSFSRLRMSQIHKVHQANLIIQV